MQNHFSTIREQLIGITASIVLIFLLTGGAALYFLLHGTVTQATSAIILLLIAVPSIALIGYQHGREMAGYAHGSDAVHVILGFAAFTGLVYSLVGASVLLHRAGLV